MKKLFLGLLAVLLTVCACAVSLLLWDVGSAALQSHSVTMQPLTASLSDEQLEKERSLARWHNFSIREETAWEIPIEVYESLLDFGSGKMGYLELPSQGLYLPIVHESEYGENVAVHCFGTALPIGGRGNCPVLRCKGISLAEGEYFQIHILDMILTYQATENLALDKTQEDLCVLELSSEGETVSLTGVRVKNTSQMD